MDSEDEEDFEGAYEDGHWIWDEAYKGLVFVSDRPPVVYSSISLAVAAIVPTGDFKDDIDVLEQDIKDLVLYTAPIGLLSPMLINLLHLPTTERFIRALIFYCQYYLQISDEMDKRIKELDTKIRTIPESDKVEAEFRENLCDLRAIVAKEYSVFLIGGSDTKKFHHMGAEKKRKSLSGKDARMFETLLRMCLQIVWLALTRRSYNKIELEINRMFKSDWFNTVEHTLKTNYIAKMTKEQRDVLLGKCVKRERRLNTHSPLMDETFCNRFIDYRMMGLGVVNYYDMLPPRLKYMYIALAAPEKELEPNGVTCGILGLSRKSFDTTLHVLPTALDPKMTKVSTASTGSKHSKSSNTSTMTMSTKVGGKGRSGIRDEITNIYHDIVLPPKEIDEPPLPDVFPNEPMAVRHCSEVQRKKWQARLQRILHPNKHIGNKNFSKNQTKTKRY